MISSRRLLELVGYILLLIAGLALVILAIFGTDRILTSTTISTTATPTLSAMSMPTDTDTATPTPTNAPTPTPTYTATPTPTDTPAPTPPDTAMPTTEPTEPTATPTFTCTPVPTVPTEPVTTITPEPTSAQVSGAPLPIGPGGERCYGGTVEFSWNWYRELSNAGDYEGEFFALRIWPEGGEKISVAWVKETSYLVPLKDYCNNPEVGCYWNVAVVKQTGPDRSHNWKYVSPESEPLWFCIHSADPDPPTPTSKPPTPKPPEPTSPKPP